MKTRAYKLGRLTYYKYWANETDNNTNPFKIFSNAWRDWDKGYNDAKETN